MSKFQIGDIVVVDSQNRMRCGNIGCIWSIEGCGLCHVRFPDDRWFGSSIYHADELRYAAHEEKLKFVGNFINV